MASISLTYKSVLPIATFAKSDALMTIREAEKRMNKTKGQLEAEICEALIKFEKEYMGRGPLETKAYIIDDMVLVRLKNVLTQSELKLAEDTERKDRRELIKQIRTALLEQGRPLLEDAMEKIVGVKVKSLHTDISTVTGEKVILFSLASPPAYIQSRNRL